jgi:hypothetical protein
MKTKMLLTVIMSTLLLPVPSAFSQRAGQRPDAQSSPGVESCPWTAEIARDWVRSPVQMDIHAGYRIFAFQSDGTIGYRIRGEFPFAAFMSFTIYHQFLVYAALTEYQIHADPGSINPFYPEGELVHTPNRSYTISVLPDGAVPDTSLPNPIFMAPLPPGTNRMTVVLVQRIYLAEPKVKDRFGGVDAPTIEAFEVSTRTPVACPSGNFTDITDQFGSVSGNFSQSPLPRDGKIEFYRPPASTVPFADSSSPLTENDCTSYLMATVYPDKLAVIHLPALPTFFDNTHIKNKTRFENPEARYISMGSYGATPLGEGENENIAGPDIKTLPDGSATFVAIPIRILLSDTTEAREVWKTAHKLGYNVLPLAEYGPLIPLAVNGSWINPFLIYRTKLPAEGFAGSVANVPCFQGSTFGDAPSDYAASPANMGKYAPEGIECSVSDFLDGRCGWEFSGSGP